MVFIFTSPLVTSIGCQILLSVLPPAGQTIGRAGEAHAALERGHSLDAN
jgi:hypothetical protein